MAFTKPSKLRAFLYRAPQPTTLTVTTSEGEKQEIVIATKGSAKQRWDDAEQSVIGCEAATVACVGKDGKILRSMKLDAPDRDDDADEPSSARALGEHRRELATVIRAINEAYDKGAAAASSSQDHLVDLVSMLTQHLALAITNLHNVSVNLANIVQSSADSQEPAGNGDVLKQLLGLAMAKQLQSAAGGGAVSPDQANGKGKSK